jgi:hypothetical protein
MAWEDQGLYFTLIFNGIVVTVCLVVGWALHRAKGNWRIMRPNRPGSTTARLFEDKHHFVEEGEDEVLQLVGVRPALHVLLLKFMSHVFIGMLLSSILIVALCATDDYLNRYASQNDPDKCGDKDAGECADSKKCEALAGAAGAAASCLPKMRHGLFDFSVQNLSPGETFRLYLFAIGCLACCIPIFFILRRTVNAINSILYRAYTGPVHAHQQYGTISTVGARSVMVAGMPTDAKMLFDKTLFLEYLRSEPEKRKEILAQRLSKDEMKAANAKVAAEEAEARGNATAAADAKTRRRSSTEPVCEQEGEDVTVQVIRAHGEEDVIKIPEKAPHGTEPIEPSNSDLTAPSWTLMERAAPASLHVIRCPPDDMMDLMKEEDEILTALKDAYANEQAETDPEKKPVTKRVIPMCCKAVVATEYETERLHEVRDKLRTKIEERSEQPMTGVGIITFDRASAASAFVRSFQNEQGFFDQQTAQIAGDRDGIIWENLSIIPIVATIRFVIMVSIFVWLCFFWSIPVAFLGNLENLANLPGVGPVFASAFAAVPLTIMGILSAYLPTIVLTVFNILLPTIFRFFGRMGGTKHTDYEAKTVLLMCSIFSIMTGIVLQAALQGGFAQCIKLITAPSGDAVRALVLAIVSPSGGYWYAFLISAACLGAGLMFLLLGPLIMSKIFGKMANRQESYDGLFKPRATDYPYALGRHIFFAAIGILFHGTVAFLQPFSVLYTVMTYFIVRSNIVDGGERDDRPVYNFHYVRSAVHTILTLHTIAAVGNTLVCGLKESIGAAIIAGLSIIASIVFHVYAHYRLTRYIIPTPETIAELESAALSHGLEPLEAVKPFVPDYATYAIDEAAEEKIRSTNYTVDKTWHEGPKEIQDAEQQA